MAHLCRACQQPLNTVFVDLGSSPLANSYLRPEQLQSMEPRFPLTVYICDQCLFVQLAAYEAPENIFSDYAYFSSFSTAWLEHARQYAEMTTARFGLTASSKVVEIASNDGYLLRNFHAAGIPVLGVEPAANVAAVAREAGIPTEVMFFGEQTSRDLASRGHAADLICANNVLAHVPDIHSFVEGLRILLKPTGTVTIEFPHLLQLVNRNQFDTIYHEHYSYLSLIALEPIVAQHDLQVCDVEELPTHGGSLRVYLRHRVSDPVQPGVDLIREKERAAGLDSLQGYLGFAEKVKTIKFDLLEFLIVQARAGKKVVAYGAAAKGNTLLNYCGVGPEMVRWTVDRSPHKQGRFLPGTRIPIYSPDRIMQERPDFVLILPWNLRDEIALQMKEIRNWGGQFVVPIPALEVF